MMFKKLFCKAVLPGLQIVHIYTMWQFVYSNGEQREPEIVTDTIPERPKVGSE